MDYISIVNERFAETARNFEALCELSNLIAQTGNQISSLMKQDGMTMFAGNGGSAADSQHLAAELQGRFLHDRRPFSSIALTSNTSTMTAIANDYSYDEIFDRQIVGLAKPGDIFVGISTSGNSKNVLRAMEAANKMDVLTIALTGKSGGSMKEVADIAICVPSTHTARIQEMHIAVGHMLCEIIEQELK